MADQEDLRYPVGRFRPPTENTRAVRAAHIETLRLLPERLQSAVAGLSDAQLDTPYRDGGWTVRQVVHHFADSHANSYIRFKLALTEDWPTIKPYDEAAWARLPDSSQPIEPSLVFIAGLHRRLVALLESMPEEDFRSRLQSSGTRADDSRREPRALRVALAPPHRPHHQPARPQGW